MKVQEDRVVAVNGFGNTVGRFFVLSLKGSEYTIPDNKCRSIILVEIALVAGMMYTMMRRSSKDKFNRSGQFAYVLGVYPELIQYFDLMADKKSDRIKSRQRYRYEKYDFDILGPSQPE